jgi:cell fate (sporulation/competence/biofilm development) regulator YlbF (YheA/YmcA/DUF963 family)
VINRIQKLRKTMDLNVADRIKVYYQADAKLQHVISDFSEMICQETLTTELVNESVADMQDNEIDGYVLQLAIG